MAHFTLWSRFHLKSKEIGILSMIMTANLIQSMVSTKSPIICISLENLYEFFSIAVETRDVDDIPGSKNLIPGFFNNTSE